MMVVDASALAAIMLNEPEADHFVAVLDSAIGEIFISPVSLFEAVNAVARVRKCPVSDARASVSAFLQEAGMQVAPATAETGEEAITAFDRFGKGRHPAALNMGDCFSYALANVKRLPLLFKGNDLAVSQLKCNIL